MNRQRATALEMSLVGTSVGNWVIRELIDHGKSAAVFKAVRNGSECALKIFDTEIVEQYGRLTQLNRIERELALSDHEYPNLVKIYEGGECPHTGNLYLAMELIYARSLSTEVATLQRNRIRSIIREIASAALYLEERCVAHRDIKPSNIVITRDKAVLLDLGVLRAISHPGGTDIDDERPFIGTLQYSPPEFLLREEEDTLEGWRAVTFYQLGAVLYDMIERKSIFHGFREPYARLVNAVQEEVPRFTATDVPSDLIQLAENCLLKDPKARIRLVSWGDFEEDAPDDTPAQAARATLTNRKQASLPQANPSNARTIENVALEETAQQLQDIIQDEFVQESTLPPVKSHGMKRHSNGARFSFSFAPNHLLSLGTYFAVEFIVEVVDTGSRAFTLHAAAWLSSSEVDDSVSRPKHIRVYSGLIHPQSVVQSVQNFVLPSFVDALNVQDSVSELESTLDLIDIYLSRDES